ncbi:hypothetical protein Daus18300_009690 [Diaporthe australafricana]|uniref:Uncharacterized protein n=1 Tax=Diaporthe australafricana TaxID=127596 RepID=A0ABR3WDF6_9PEZI
MEDVYPQADQGRKPKRLRQKDLEELRGKVELGEDKQIPIWQKAGPGQPHTPFIDGFSRDALMTFSPCWKSELEAAPAFLTVQGPYLNAYKLLLNWIKLCVEEGNDIKFPDIDEPENEPTEHQLKPKRESQHQLRTLLDVIAAANHVKIPEGSLQTGLKKRLPGCARKHILDLDTVERIYSNEDPDYDDDLQEAAAISIFEAWWTYKLDDAEFDDYMSRLEDMRVEYPQLDADLHQQFDRKKEFIEGKREERKRNRDGEGSAPYANTGFDNPGGGTTSAGFDSVGGAGDTGGDGWSQAAAMMTTDGGTEGEFDWEKAMQETPSWATASASMW